VTAHDATSPFGLGEVLAGKYRVERVLGAGAMGVVVEATHLQLEQRVAIKYLRDVATPDQEAIARFSREARAAVKLRGEHVARVIDVGAFEGGSPYIVMEYLEGEDLGQRLADHGPLPFDEAAEWILQACEALAEAHGLGIVHRDLKPRNLFITTGVDGKPLLKVLDFGIAKWTKQTGSSDDLALTKTTDIMGSPSYMSPEQLRSSRDADVRSDIWALGVILYELVTGRVPFDATSVGDLTAMVLRDAPPPPSKHRPDVPPGLEKIILRCLEKEREGRFQTVAELALAVEPFARSRDQGKAARVQSVAAATQSAPSLPVVRAPARPSGGTFVAWGESDGARGRRSRAPRYIALATSVISLAVVAGFLYATRPHATLTAAPTQLPESRVLTPVTPPTSPSVAITATAEAPAPVASQTSIADVPRKSPISSVRAAASSGPSIQTTKQPPAVSSSAAERKPDPHDLDSVGRK
jgi:serine/threonine-protein kinase